jgi:hypothetical protein
MPLVWPMSGGACRAQCLRRWGWLWLTLIDRSLAGMQGASVAKQGVGGFRMAVAMFVGAAVLFGLLWLAIDSNRFKIHAPSPTAQAVSSSQVTTTTAAR